MIQKRRLYISMAPVIYFAIASSVFSQIEVVKGIFRPLMYVFWGLVLMRSMVKVAMTRFTSHFLVAYAFLVAFCLFCALLGYNHLNSNYLQLLVLPLMMTMVSGYLSNNFTKQVLINVVIVYIGSSLIFAMWVHLTYFMSYRSWLASSVYFFNQKNSAVQIWSVALLLTHFVLLPRYKHLRYFWYVISAYLFFLVGVSQGRTAIVALFMTMLVYYVLFFDAKKKLLWFLFAIMVGLLIWNNPIAKQFINRVFLLEKYAGADTNTMLSGRLDNYTRAIAAFENNFLVGTGRWYVDNSYLSILAEVGIIGFILIESIWIHRLALNVKIIRFKMQVASSFQQLIVLLTVFYFIVSFMEGYPPFGPGVSAFMFWLLCGYYDSVNKAGYLSHLNAGKIQTCRGFGT